MTMDFIPLWLTLLIVVPIGLFVIYIVAMSRTSWHAPCWRAESGIAGLIVHGEGSWLTVTKNGVLAVKFIKAPDTGYEEQMVRVCLMPDQMDEGSCKAACKVIRSWESSLRVPVGTDDQPMDRAPELVLVGEYDELLAELKAVLEKLVVAAGLTIHTMLRFKREFQSDELTAARAMMPRLRDAAARGYPVGRAFATYQKERIEKLEDELED